MLRLWAPWKYCRSGSLQKGGSGVMNSSIFRKKSIERISSPEQLTDYIRVARPGVWIVLSAVLVLLASFLVWGIFGTLPDTFTVNGVVKDGIVTCYVNDTANIYAGMEATAGGTTGTVETVGRTPLSADEIEKLYQSDYTLKMLDIAQWNYPVTVRADGVPDGIAKVVIVGNPVHPISFLFDRSAS